MSYVIDLAWPAVALTFGALVVWRVDRWLVAGKSSLAGKVDLLDTYAGDARDRLRHVSEQLEAHGRNLIQLNLQTDRLEAALKAPTPAVERHTKEALQRFR